MQYRKTLFYLGRTHSRERGEEKNQIGRWVVSQPALFSALFDYNRTPGVLLTVRATERNKELEVSEEESS